MPSKLTEFVFSPEALQDLRNIRSYTLKNFGEKTLDLYDNLISQAIHDLSINTKRLGVRRVEEITKNCYAYPIRYSKSDHKSNYHIKHPRHFILFHQDSAEQFEIFGILHEKRHLSFLENNIPD